MNTPQRFLQTPFWAEFKGAHGWTPLFFTLGTEGEAVLVRPADKNAPRAAGEFPLTVLVREFSLAVTRLSLAYIPLAPEPADAATAGLDAYWDFLSRVAAALRPHLPRNTAFVRFDPPIDYLSVEERDAAVRQAEASFLRQPRSRRLSKSSVDIQPPDTVLLALDADEESLLAAMKSKWRYNIRLAAKKGVTVTKHYATDADFDAAFEEFYSLFTQTAERDKVSFHDKEYYRDLLCRGAPADNASTAKAERPLVTLYLAHHEGDALAGIITLFCAREAVYLYGASGNIKRNLMPAYLLQWTAIRDAQAAGCPVYDFYGIPPTDDEAHPMHGLYLFKTGFGGQPVHRPGSMDAGFGATYRLYCAAERLRAWWHKKARKKLR